MSNPEQLNEVAGGSPLADAEAPAPATAGWARQAFVLGPDDAPGDEPIGGRLATLLSWPVRLILVLGALSVGFIFNTSPIGRQLGWGLEYGALIALSLAASGWLYILIVNLVFGGGWVTLSWQPPSEHDPAWKVALLRGFTFVNRQLGHLEALGVWLVIALVWRPVLAAQLTLVAAVVLLGEPIINGLARTRFFGGAAAQKRNGSLFLERRSLFYLAALLGLAGLALLAPYQVGKLLPLFCATGVGLLARYVRFRLRKRQERRERTARGSSPTHRLRLERVRRQRQLSSWADGILGPGVALGGIVLLACFSLYARQRMNALIRQNWDGPAPAADACIAEPGGPLDAPIGMFMISDSQLHELGGKRFPGQMEVSDALVSVALRPVELDMLSAATVLRYRQAYGELAEKRADAGLSPPLWAHLGDFADLSCYGEMSRALQLLAGFAPSGRLAGVAPGNHDRSFTGNFFWSPFWDGACAAPPAEAGLLHGRLEKEGSDLMLQAGLSSQLTLGGDMQRLSSAARPSRFVEGASALVSVSPLGSVQHEGLPRGVLGIFYDSSDTHASDFGIAGLWGSFSAQQSRRILELVDAARQREGYRDPLFVLFGHHPLDEMAAPSRERLEKMIAQLDRGGAGPGDLIPPHVIGVVTAHTHLAQRLRHCVAKRQLRELVLSSTIDPPQEAAWIEIGTDRRGRAALRLRTLPAVERPGFACEPALMPSAARCRSLVAGLAAQPECEPLFSRSDGGNEPGPACEQLERELTLDQQLTGLVLHGGPDEPADIRLAQTRRAQRLLTCTCRGGGCSVPADPLAGEAYAGLLSGLAEEPARLEELTCLSWAASAVQGHKAAGMEMADAMRCAFDDPAIPAAQVSVATLEDLPCP